LPGQFSVLGCLRLTPLSRPQNWKNKVDAPALNIDSQ
jgi:hypothetical protein